jgi:hypothetical protein
MITNELVGFRLCNLSQLACLHSAHSRDNSDRYDMFAELHCNLLNLLDKISFMGTPLPMVKQWGDLSALGGPCRVLHPWRRGPRLQDSAGAPKFWGRKVEFF